MCRNGKDLCSLDKGAQSSGEMPLSWMMYCSPCAQSYLEGRRGQSSSKLVQANSTSRPLKTAVHDAAPSGPHAEDGEHSEAAVVDLLGADLDLTGGLNRGDSGCTLPGTRPGI
jgi:hypothetical protein